jgi:UDP-N-acetylmuramate--alanine ligase
MSTFRHIYFLGIGGIGMSALARFCRKKGFSVAGYDKTPTPLTQQLSREGIDITYDEKAEVLADLFSFSPDDSLVVFTPAITNDHPQFRFFMGNGYRVIKRSVMLGEICRDYTTLAVAGTHGKTTTSSMVAHLLKSAGIDCNAFLGGISTNYNTNLLSGNDPFMVVEADEYDRSFLTLYPRAAIITSMDADHLDIYGEKNALEQSFRLFAAQVENGGVLIHHHSLSLAASTGVQKYTYALEAPADYYAENIHIENGSYCFDVCGKISIKGARLGMPGLHNVENALAAVALASSAGAAEEGIAEGLKSFSGVKRRFEKIFSNSNTIYIDDYAHHPREISSCVQSLRALYPGKKITAVFQPHLFSRTRDFLHDFAGSLEQVDRLYLLDIYPAREVPIPGITSRVLFDIISLPDKHMSSLGTCLHDINPASCEVLLTIGAGDIDTLVEPIRNSLEESYGENKE